MFSASKIGNTITASSPSGMSTYNIQLAETTIITTTEVENGRGAKMATLASASTPQRATISPVIFCLCHLIGCPTMWSITFSVMVSQVRHSVRPAKLLLITTPRALNSPIPMTITEPATSAPRSILPLSKRTNMTRSIIHLSPIDDATVQTANRAAPRTAIKNSRG